MLDEIPGGYRLTIVSNDFKDGEPIPAMFSGYNRGGSPALAWSDLPPATHSLALIVEDPDAPSARPFVHWVIFNIPATETSLRADIPNDKKTEHPPAIQGVNSANKTGYMGPMPPPGDPPHHYHFQLFALDTELTLDDSAGRDEVFAAIHGHVLAKGEVVGTFAKS